MASNEEAQAAIQQFNGYQFEGRELRVNVAEERPARGSGNRY
jgi:RNA recognition motif-containing protein